MDKDGKFALIPKGRTEVTTMLRVGVILNRTEKTERSLCMLGLGMKYEVVSHKFFVGEDGTLDYDTLTYGLFDTKEEAEEIVVELDEDSSHWDEKFFVRIAPEYSMFDGTEDFSL